VNNYEIFNNSDLAILCILISRLSVNS